MAHVNEQSAERHYRRHLLAEALEHGEMSRQLYVERQHRGQMGRLRRAPGRVHPRESAGRHRHAHEG